jgi:hypothetical protein
LVGALVAFGHAAVVVGHAHFQRGDADALEPFTQAALAVPFGVPVGQNQNGRGSLVRAVCGQLGREQLGIDLIVFRPGGLDGTGKGQDVFVV